MTENGGAPAPRVPDFFIVGHQKCGTTAMYEMLRRLPQIYLPDVKEPRFFSSEERSPAARATPARPRTLEDYLALFAAARADQLCGDASPQYLQSERAAQRIAELRPDARIIAILREPASYLRSFHMQMVSSNVEPERDFAKALALEPQRREGRHPPRRGVRAQALFYSEHVRYVEQLRRFHDAFGREQVLVLIYEDFRAENEATVRRVLRFLGIDADGPTPIDAVETRRLKSVRSPALHRMRLAVRVARDDPKHASPLARAGYALLPPALRRDAFKGLVRRAAYGPPRQPDDQLMLDLRRRFKAEVEALSAYLERDLVTFWRYDELG